MLVELLLWRDCAKEVTVLSHSFGTLVVNVVLAIVLLINVICTVLLILRVHQLNNNVMVVEYQADKLGRHYLPTSSIILSVALPNMQ